MRAVRARTMEKKEERIVAVVELVSKFCLFGIRLVMVMLCPQV